MPIIDRYLLSEWMKILGLVVCAMVGPLLIFAIYDNFRELLATGAGLLEILLYYVTVLPSYLSVVLPIALLLSLLFILGKLHRNNEITALRAAGLNIFATTRILWIASLGFCALSFLLNARIVPWSVETSRRMIESFQYRAEEAKAPTGVIGLVTGVTFDNRRANRMWYINRYSRYKQEAYGVTVSELDRERRVHFQLAARTAHFDPAQHAWVFTDGRETWVDPDTGDKVQSNAFTEKVIPYFNEDPSLMLLIDRNPRDLSFFELRRIVDYFTVEDDPKLSRYAVRYYGLLADTMGPLIILAIALPFSVTGVRVSPAVGVSKSIGLFFAYYILTNIATVLGGSNWIEPVWAACLPDLAMVGIAAVLFGRLR
ncbi:MAG TPA: LptF/LptG family permease [Candidatus Didemnitutus sp.]|nr:LptF/LptG family permease [Candidatus Didemnitutus sp.]